VFCWSWIEQLPYISPVKKVQLQQFENLRKAMIQFCPKLVLSKQKHGDAGNPDLRHYRSERYSFLEAWKSLPNLHSIAWTISLANGLWY